MAFKALLATKTPEKISVSLIEMDEKNLMPGEQCVTEVAIGSLSDTGLVPAFHKKFGNKIS